MTATPRCIVKANILCYANMVVILCAANLLTSVEAYAQEGAGVTILHSFGDGSVANDGVHPYRGFIAGSDGNLYGVTNVGGAASLGALYRCTPSGTLTILHSFSDGSFTYDGRYPSDLIQGANGDLYGATFEGGTYGYGGMIFRYPLGGPLSNFISFSSSDTVTTGYSPLQIIQGADANFYGLNRAGGDNSNASGTLFKADSIGNLSVLHSFDFGGIDDDGADPSALVQGTDANIYGTTFGGGAAFDGTIFKCTPGGTLTILHSFGDGSVANDGGRPCGLVQGSDGCLYGITSYGGADNAGTVFRCSSAGMITILHSFSDGTVANDGYSPTSVIIGADGNLYGTTEQGGSAITGGTVFKCTLTGQVTILHSFGDGTVSNDGSYPNSRLARASDGRLYGTTMQGGATRMGTVFAISPQPATPLGLGAVGGNGAVVLTWPANSYAASFDLFRSTSPGGEGATPYIVKIPQAYFVDRNVTNGVRYYYRVAAVNVAGASALSTEASALPEVPAAAFVGMDRATAGNWKGNYGVDGYLVIGARFVKTPSYVTLTAIHNIQSEWVTNSTAPYCLQMPNDAVTEREAGVWWSPTGFSIDIDMTDANTHRVALYFLDWTSAGRLETVTINDAVTGQSLDTRTMSNFGAGVYGVWNIKGHVVVRIVKASGPNAVVSAVFFGPGSGATAPPAPTNLNAAAGVGKITLTWSPSPGATSYSIFRSTTPGIAGMSPLLWNSPEGLTDSAVQAGATYYYQVMAANTVGGSFASNEVHATVPK